jgi:hypothetical protein
MDSIALGIRKFKKSKDINAEVNIPCDYSKKQTYRSLVLKLSDCESAEVSFKNLAVNIELDDSDYRKFDTSPSY